MAKDYDAWESMFAEPSSGGSAGTIAMGLAGVGLVGGLILALNPNLSPKRGLRSWLDVPSNHLAPSGYPATIAKEVSINRSFNLREPLFRKDWMQPPQYSNATDLQEFVRDSSRALKAIYAEVDELLEYRHNHRESHDTGYEAAKHNRIDERLAELEEQSKLINMDLDLIFASIGDWFAPPLVRETDPESTRRYL